MVEEEKITTTMQSSAVMQPSCTRGSRQLFPVNKGGGGGEGGRGEQATGGG